MVALISLDTLFPRSVVPDDVNRFQTSNYLQYKRSNGREIMMRRWGAIQLRDRMLRGSRIFRIPSLRGCNYYWIWMLDT